MEELLRKAILGLGRLTQDEQQEVGTEEHFLGEIARESVIGRAAWIPAVLQDEDEDIPPVETEDHWFSSEAGRCLEALLGGRQPELLREFLGLCVSQQKLVSPRYLPRLFHLAMRTPISGKLLMKATGARGKWLANRHPQWKILLPADQQAWKHGNAGERSRYWVALREQAPEEARQLLKELVKSKSWKELERHLPGLMIGFSDADLPFIEEMTTHRRSAIRKISIGLAAVHPKSEMVRQAVELADEVLSGQSGINLNLAPLDQWDQLANYEPLIWSMPKGTGDRGRLLTKFLSLIPLAHWEKRFAKHPTQLISQLPEHLWGEALYQGWLLASIQQENQGWATELLRLVLAPEADPQRRKERGFRLWLPMDLRSPLMSLVPDPERNSLLNTALLSVDPIHSSPMAFWMLEHYPTEMPSEMATAFAKRLMQTLEVQSAEVNRELRELLPRLPAATRVMPITVYADLLSIWAINPGYPQWFDPFLHNALQVLGFRRRMQEAFSPS